MFESIRDYLPGVHKEGYLFILIFIVITFLLFAISQSFGWLGLILTMWCVFFFRDPNRMTYADDNLVISPADGIVQSITQTVPPAELKMGNDEMIRISIFLSVFDVHVNRVPVQGKVKALHYNAGKFFNASLDKASEHNERQSILIEAKGGQQIAVVQIAGLIARRIVCNLKEGEEVSGGQRFGIIRFGSRVDIYLPHHINPQVLEKQYMIGGETIIADLGANLPARKGEVR